MRGCPCNALQMPSSIYGKGSCRRRSDRGPVSLDADEGGVLTFTCRMNSNIYVFMFVFTYGCLYPFIFVIVLLPIAGLPSGVEKRQEVNVGGGAQCPPLRLRGRSLNFPMLHTHPPIKAKKAKNYPERMKSEENQGTPVFRHPAKNRRKRDGKGEKRRASAHRCWETAWQTNDVCYTDQGVYSPEHPFPTAAIEPPDGGLSNEPSACLCGTASDPCCL